MDFSDYLRHTRNFYGLTLAEFGEQIDFSPSHICDVERKRKVASDKMRAAVLREFPRNKAFERFLEQVKASEFTDGG